MKIKQKEADIIKTISDYLSTKKYIHWRQNSGAYSDQYKGKKRFIKFFKWLYPTSNTYEQFTLLDIIGYFPNGLPFQIEVKAPGKKPTKAQYNTIELLQQNGVMAFWVDNVEDVQKYMSYLSNRKRNT